MGASFEQRRQRADFMPAALGGVVVAKDDCGFNPTATRTVVLTSL